MSEATRQRYRMATEGISKTGKTGKSIGMAKGGKVSMPKGMKGGKSGGKKGC